MSAILGIWHRDERPVDSDMLHRMMAPLAFRGPDRSGTWFNGTVGLGYHHLAYTPESVHEQQPATHPSDQWTIVADARIDNREELLLQLGRPATDSMPDSELILLAYLEWGEDCARRLLGDFAFAIWDARKHQLFCARDHMGVRPFYYAQSQTSFFFASGIPGILAGYPYGVRINETKLAQTLAPTVEDKASTCYQEIFRLPNAHYMVVGPERTRLVEYWTLDDQKELPPASDQEYAEELHAIFSKAVARRVRSAFPVGATLSGGLDSSSNVVTARRFSGSSYPGQLHTFSAKYTGQPYDESAYFESVIAQGGVVPHVVECNDIRPLQYMRDALQYLGELFYGPNLCIQMHLYPYVQNAGVRVLLEGFDGDSTLCHGVDRIAELAQAGNLIQSIREARALAREFDVSPGRTILNRVLIPGIPRPLRSVGRTLRKRPIAPLKRWDVILDNGFTSRAKLADAFKRPVNDRVSVRQRHAQVLRGGFFQTALEIMNPVALRHGFHAAYPYCDVSLMEFCVALPSDQKLRSGLTRYVMHHAMSDLPEKVRWRKTKTNVTPIVISGMHRWHQDILQAVALTPAPVMARYIDTSYAKLAYQRYFHQPSTSDGLSLWKTFMLASWLHGPSHNGQTLLQRTPPTPTSGDNNELKQEFLHTANASSARNR